jgi:hypothetical protein
MKAFQRTARRFGIEGPGGYAVCIKIIKQGPRNGCLADPALIRAYQNHYWLRHLQTPRSSRSNRAIEAFGCLVWRENGGKQFINTFGHSRRPQQQNDGLLISALPE